MSLYDDTILKAWITLRDLMDHQDPQIRGMAATQVFEKTMALEKDGMGYPWLPEQGKVDE